MAGALALARLARGRRRLPPLRAVAAPAAATISVVVPARDEAGRIGPCLSGLAGDPDVLETIVVVDDDDRSDTAAVAAAGGARVVVAPSLPRGWVGKPWALQHGLEAARGSVLVTLDADTRPSPGLPAALAWELEDGADLVTAGTRFVCETFGERLLHPAMLATLVYRFGPAGVEESGSGRAHRAVANGQCQGFRREQLAAAGGFARAPDRMTDDIALARSLVAEGWRIRFLDGADLISVRMHASMREVWREWGRSLSMQDVTPRGWQALDLLVLWAAMALPLLRVLVRRSNRLDVLLVGVRFVLLVPLRHVYARRGVAFWLSPLVDAVAAARLTLSTVRPIRTWRGRTYPPSRPTPDPGAVERLRRRAASGGRSP